jgi:NAD(P)H-quinone oxidoreductase subunit 5
METNEPCRTGYWTERSSGVTLADVISAIVNALPDVLTRSVRIDRIAAVMLVLVALVGWVVARYSRAYLDGDPRVSSYRRRLAATLAAVAVVVTANDLVVLAIAWAATSIALHGLLTFCRDRPAAVAVAHKKFLLARCADACMLGAIAAFAGAFGTTRIDTIVGEAVAGTLPVLARVGIALVAVAAVMKCAQLPFHGWLIQVMEAPTPVSALLHAGVVNLGGFVLLRLAPVVDRAVETRALLVVVGACTAVVAALVMATRVSVKVALAWSTCAQMGFMLVQCGLGLWEMALLHLVAHSLYKAHAFLSAGGTVRQTSRRRLLPAARTPRWLDVVGAAAVSAIVVAAVGLVWSAVPGADRPSTAVWTMLAVVAIAGATLARPAVRPSLSSPAAVAIAAAQPAAVAVVYLALHDLAALIVPHGAAPPTGLLVVFAAAMAALFVLHTAVVVAPDGAPARLVRPWIYAGLFLDEAVTRTAFTVSPPPPTAPRVGPLPQPAVRLLLPADITAYPSRALVDART